MYLSVHSKAMINVSHVCRCPLSKTLYFLQYFAWLALDVLAVFPAIVELDTLRASCATFTLSLKVTFLEYSIFLVKFCILRWKLLWDCNSRFWQRSCPLPPPASVTAIVHSERKRYPGLGRICTQALRVAVEYSASWSSIAKRPCTSVKIVWIDVI